MEALRPVPKELHRRLELVCNLGIRLPCRRTQDDLGPAHMAVGQRARGRQCGERSALRLAERERKLLGSADPHKRSGRKYPRNGRKTNSQDYWDRTQVERLAETANVLSPAASQIKNSIGPDTYYKAVHMDGSLRGSSTTVGCLVTLALLAGCDASRSTGPQPGLQEGTRVDLSGATYLGTPGLNGRPITQTIGTWTMESAVSDGVAQAPRSNSAPSLVAKMSPHPAVQARQPCPYSESVITAP